jgi:hypothetical protein
MNICHMMQQCYVYTCMILFNVKNSKRVSVNAHVICGYAIIKQSASAIYQIQSFSNQVVSFTTIYYFCAVGLFHYFSKRNFF